MEIECLPKEPHICKHGADTNKRAPALLQSRSQLSHGASRSQRHAGAFVWRDVCELTRLRLFHQPGSKRWVARGPLARHVPFLQMGQHWSGSYTGSTHSVWGHADTVHSTSPLASQRHRSHGDTWNRSPRSGGTCRRPYLSNSRFPSPNIL